MGIENRYRQKYGEEYGVLQVQVGMMTDKAGTKEFDFNAKANQCLQPGDTVVMDVQTNLATPRQMPGPPQYTEEMLDQIRKGLRFELNDRVLCNCGPRWLSGHVVGAAVPDASSIIPYLVKTDPRLGLPSKTLT